MDARSLLEKRLGEFLGFEDESLSDILEHLLSVESERDLRDYLSQLLGSEDDGIQDFVKDIGRFQRGEPILAKAENDEDHRSPPIANAAEVETKPTSSAGKVTTAQDKKSAATNQQQKAIIKDETATTIRAKESQLAPLNYGKTNVVPPLPQKTKTSATTKTEEATAQPAATVLSVKKKHGLPPKGEAKRNCGCFGTLHKPLTNCLYCGRIACEDEGYQFCPFCGYLVEEVKPSEGNRYVCFVLFWCYAFYAFV